MKHVRAALRGRPSSVIDTSYMAKRGGHGGPPLHDYSRMPLDIALRMPLDIDDDTRGFIIGHRVARLATAGEDLQPAVIPICYVFDGEHIYSAIDEKPKSVAASSLKRVRNIEANPRVALVIDDYSEDWSKLAYVLIAGAAEIILPGKKAGKEATKEASNEAQEHARAVRLLREKYPQYRSMKIDERPMIKIRPSRIKRWGAR